MGEVDTKKGPGLAWWVPTLYFAEGFPYALVRNISTVFFTDAGASLQAIGLTSLYGLPWTLKLLWAPLVDAFSSKRRWIVAAEAVLATLTAVTAFASGLASPLAVVSVLFLLLAIASATHDIAVDGYYLEALDRTRQARWVGLQAGAYRLALVFGSGVVVTFSGWTSWPAGFALAAGLLALLLSLHATLLPRAETPRRPAGELLVFLVAPRTLALVAGAAAVGLALRWLLRLPAAAPVASVLGTISVPEWILLLLFTAMAVTAIRAPALKRRLYASRSTYALAFVDYLDRPRVGLVLAFIALYRSGESFLLNMAYPFLSSIGITRAQYGLAYGTFGILASITGGILGGALIARFGLRRCIWPFVLAQNVLNLLYMTLAWQTVGMTGESVPASPPLVLVTALIVVEAFGAGLGTAAFMVFVMRTTRPAHKAAHMAIATGLATVSATMAGVISGFLASALGFTLFFAFTFLATVPAMAMIPFLPGLDGDAGPEAARP